MVLCNKTVNCPRFSGWWTSFIVMNGEPDRDLPGCGPGHPVPEVGRQMEEIPGDEVTDPGFSFKGQPCLPLEQQHPFAPGLVVPEIRRTGLAGGDDALDAQAGAGQEFLKPFLFPGGRGQVGEQVV